MEIKINKEIRDYTENVFFGLSMRQFIFSALACASAVVIFFQLRPYFGTETVSWICVLAAAPFAALGFIKYNGLPAEKLLTAWIKCIVMPDKLTFKPKNLYYELMRDHIDGGCIRKDRRYDKKS